MDLRLPRLPFSAKVFLALQTLLAIVSLFFITFEAFYLSPQKQLIKLDRLSNDLAVQLQLISPLSHAKISRLLTASSAHNIIDKVSITWQGQQWQFDHARTAINKKNNPKAITSSALIYSLDETKTLGELTTSTKVQYRLNYLLAYSVALLAILISMFFTLYFYLTIKKENSIQATLPTSTEKQQQALAIQESEKAELSLAKKSALEASRVKSTIIANTSHELLTPLNSIVGFSKILLDKKIDNEQQDNFLQRIHDNALHLAALVNDLLDFSVRSNRMLPLNYQATDIHDLLLSITNTMAYEAQSKGLSFIVDFDEVYGYEIHTDPLRLRQLISNIAINAIRYTNSGHVKITAHFARDTRQAHSNTDTANTDGASNDQKTLLLGIEDTGIGIAKDQQKNIFASFVSSTSSIKNNNNPGLGLGLGLSIVSTILQRMGATIEIESELNKGSYFKIKVPIKKYKKIQYKKTNTLDASKIYKHILISGDYPPALNTLEQRLHTHAKKITLNLAKINNMQQYGDADLIVFNADKKTVDLLNADENTIANNLINLNKSLVITAPIGLTIHNKALMNNHRVRVINGPFAIQSLLQSDSDSINSHSTHSNNAIANPTTIPLTPRLKTLVVDDNIANIELLSLLLDNFQCDIDSATNGQDALTRIKKQNYDWLFIDIRMQPMDGIELVKTIRQHKNYQTVPIIACTAHTSDEEFRVLMDSGFDKVTYKPIMEQQISRLKDSFFDTPTLDKQSIKTSDSVFDLQQAIDKTAGNTTVAQSIFNLFLNELQQAVKVKNSLTNEPRDNIIDFIHKLHGAAAMTGATALKNQLNQCETLLKNLPDPAESAEKAIKNELEAVYHQVELVLDWHKNNNMDSVFTSLKT